MSQAIMTAFNIALNTFATHEDVDLPVAWENVDFTPPQGPYLRGFLLPATTVAAGLGTAAKNKHTGIYQIDVIFPAGQGWGGCAAMAEKVRNAFRRGEKLGDGTILIVAASSGPAMREDGRYKIPVSVNYYAWLENEA